MKDDIVLYELLEKCKDSNHQSFSDVYKNRLIDLLLVDIRMPEVDGFFGVWEMASILEKSGTMLYH